MATAEDVFYLYERNSRHYYDNENDIEYYEENKINPVRPYTIGNQFVKCSLDRKIYIKPGEACPICFDNIEIKKNAYLTICGHSFHKKCIFDYYEHKRLDNPYSQLRCPLCRFNNGHDLKSLEYRYHINVIKPNYCDDLENFWLNKDYKLLQICSKNKKHFIGMNKNCQNCKKYRNGELIFGI